MRRISMNRTRLRTLWSLPGSTTIARGRRWLWRSDDGQDLLEYGLLVALVAIVALGAVAALGNTVNSVFWQSIANNF
jgi:Flp pilus assembly pilin Flp